MVLFLDSNSPTRIALEAGTDMDAHSSDKDVFICAEHRKLFYGIEDLNAHRNEYHGGTVDSTEPHKCLRT